MKKIPRLLQATLVIVLIYFGFIVLFDYILDEVIPASLLDMYMFFIITGVLAVFTFTEAGARELIAPLKALLEDPAKRQLRNMVFVVAPLLVAGFAYFQSVPGFEAPLELRAIHPAPPSSVKIFGERVDLTTLENPLRHYQKEDPQKFRDFVAEGAAVYVSNCQYCHGDKLDGRGLYAQGLNPVPINFQDIGTIAQLQESFLYWRIATGGPGLPKEAAPWNSSMPVWQNFLTEEEIWKVILYLYDYTGQTPRIWEE